MELACCRTRPLLPPIRLAQEPEVGGALARCFRPLSARSYSALTDSSMRRFDLDGLGGFELGNLFADGNIDHDNDKVRARCCPPPPLPSTPTLLARAQLPSVIQMKKAAEVNAVHGPQVPEHKNVTLVNAEDLMGVSARKGMSDRSAGGEGGVGKEASTNV